MGTQLMCPLKPLGIIRLGCILIFSPMMPRHASLSDSCTPDCCSFSGWLCTDWKFVPRTKLFFCCARGEILSVSCLIKPSFDHAFPIHMTPNGIPFGAKSLGKGNFPSDFSGLFLANNMQKACTYEKNNFAILNF